MVATEPFVEDGDKYCSKRASRLVACDFSWVSDDRYIKSKKFVLVILCLFTHGLYCKV